MSVTINDRSLADLVYMVSELDGHLAPTVPRREGVALANGPGVWGTTVTIEPRTITVGLDVRPTTLAARQTLMDSLKRRLAGLLELRTDDLPGRVVSCLLSGIAVEFYTGAYALPAVYVRLQFTAIDPARTDVEPLVYGLSTARTACPLGTDPVAPTLWIYGSCTNPVVIVRSAAGAEVSRMTFTVVLGTNDALLIDGGTQQITRTVAGVVQTGTNSGLAAFTSGAFPLLAPDDGTPDGAWPTIELTASSGTPTGLALYSRRW